MTLLVIGIVYFLVQDSDRAWILTIPHTYFWSVLKLNFYVAFTFVCASVLVGCADLSLDNSMLTDSRSWMSV